MALQLRRGTDAERQTITFAEGELVYTTDTKELYIGDGNTLGGVLVSGSDEPISTDGVVEGSNYRINIIGDDSSIIVDAETSSLNGTFIGDINVTSTIEFTQSDDISPTGIRLNQYGGTKLVKTEPLNFARHGIKFASWNSNTFNFVDESLIYSYHQLGGGSTLAFSPSDPSGNFFNAAIEIDGVANKTTISGPVVVNNSMKLAVYDTSTARDTAITNPEAGMLCFVLVGDIMGNPEFQGYDGTTWNKLN